MPIFNILSVEHHFGIKLSPSCEFNSTQNHYIKTKPAFGLSGGFFYDIEFNENYNLSTGIFYFHRMVNFKSKQDYELHGKQYKKKDVKYHTLSLDYCEIPILLKLFTNEIIMDTRLFFYTGPIFSIKTRESIPTDIKRDSAFFRFVNFSLTLGGGIEYEIAMNTDIFFDVGYRISTFSCAKTDGVPSNLEMMIGQAFVFSIGIRI